MNDALHEAARACLERLGAQEGERILVVYNPTTRVIARAIESTALERGLACSKTEFPDTERHGAEPPEEVARAMHTADVVFAPTHHSLSHTRARLAATRNGARVASMPGIDQETFVRAIPANYGELTRLGDALAERLTRASTCRIVTERGTDVTLYLDGRQGLNDDGDLSRPGAFGNLPAGEAYIAPVEVRGDGVIVFDASLAGHGLLSRPLSVTITAGRVTSATGEASTELLEMLDDGGEHGRSVAEIGIGTNASATVCGKILEDEKVVGTVHVAFGSSAGIGGVNQAKVHIDGVLWHPDVLLDGEPVMRHGELLI